MSDRGDRQPDAGRLVIGWREWISLPDLEIPGIKVKIDTGARTSALHTHDFEVFETPAGQRVRFSVHPLPRTDRVLVHCEAEVLDFREVTDSGGRKEARPFIRTRARLGRREWPIDLSLTNRETMRFRMLLGRQALAEDFLVDPASSYLVSKSLRRSYK